MSASNQRLSALLLFCSLAACGDGGSTATTSSISTSPSAATSVTAGAAASTPTSGVTASGTTSAIGASASPALTVTALPPGRSKAPTLDEWAARKEVTVKGSSALQCETKMVREYLRISCKGKNDSGGAPTAVKVLEGKGEVSTFSADGVTSAMVTYVEGIDVEIAFSWTDKSHTLVLRWPKGSPKPAVLGEFEGATSPLDGALDAVLSAKLCACHKRLFERPSCEDLISSANADCERTYGSDCADLLACSRGEVNVPPSCQPGFAVVAGLTWNRCRKECEAPDTSCPAGQVCALKEFGVAVCLDE